MRLFVRFLGGCIEWFFSILFLPNHLRAFLQARTKAADTDHRAAVAAELQANAQVMQILWNLGSDFRPLARYIAGGLHTAYGVRASDLAKGELIPLEKKQ